MSWWHRLRHKPSSLSLPERLRIVTLTMEGWTEERPTDQMRIWRNSQGDVLSLSTADGSLELPSLSDISGLQGWCRAVAESRGAGLIEMRLDAGRLGATVGFIYKPLEMPRYIFTGVLVVPGDGGRGSLDCRQWRARDNRRPRSDCHDSVDERRETDDRGLPAVLGTGSV